MSIYRFLISMPIKDQPIALFLFAHQDDEFGIFQKIWQEQTDGRTAICVYLTDGQFKGVASEVRNKESLAVLSQLQVEQRNILFAGSQLGIHDSKLSENIEVAVEWLRKLFQSLPDLCAIYVPAWEGGHHDHDALHAITIAVAQECGMLGKVKQFSLYNSYRCKGPLFRVFLPLPENGEVEKVIIDPSNRLRFLKFCLSYPSQRLTWIGLFPFVLFHYIFARTQQLQPVSLERINQRPHPGLLYYEKRGFFTWEKMKGCLSRIDAVSPFPSRVSQKEVRPLPRAGEGRGEGSGLADV